MPGLLIHQIRVGAQQMPGDELVTMRSGRMLYSRQPFGGRFHVW